MRSGDSNLRTSLVVSFGGHVLLLLVLYLGLPTVFKPLPIAWKPIPIDIVEIGAITNTRVRDTPEPPRTAPTARPEPSKPEPQKPEPIKMPTQPSSAAMPEPQPLQSEPTPLPTLKPQTPRDPPPPKPVAPTPKTSSALASVLRNVAKLKPATPPPAEASPDDPRPDDKAAPSGVGPALGDHLTISEEDALRRQISQCWNMPVGARDAENLVVNVLIDVNPDRTVRSAVVEDRARAASDPYFRAASDAALRALRHPKCTPLDVPPDKYEQWKTIHFTFDPRDML